MRETIARNSPPRCTDARKTTLVTKTEASCYPQLYRVIRIDGDAKLLRDAKLLPDRDYPSLLLKQRYEILRI